LDVRVTSEEKQNLAMKIVTKLKRKRNCLDSTSHAPWKGVLGEAAEHESVASFRNLQPCLKQSNKKTAKYRQ